MDYQSSSVRSSESLSELVEKACRHWEVQQPPSAVQRDLSLRVAHAFSITISRELGTQGTSVARQVGRLLNWHVYDGELLEYIAQEMGLRTTLLNSVDEKHQSLLLEAIEAFMSAPAKSECGPLVTESSYVHHLIQTVLALGVHGECVIVGRGAAFILPVETTVRVRLVGSVRERVAALSRKLGISEQDAARQARTIDHERTDFVQDHFLKDSTDPRNYDLVLNAPRLSVDQNAELIVAMLQRLRASRSETSKIPRREGITAR